MLDENEIQGWMRHEYKPPRRQVDWFGLILGLVGIIFISVVAYHLIFNSQI